MSRTVDPWAELSTTAVNASDPIIGQDFDGVIMSWNPAAEQLLGYAASDVLGRSGALLETASGLKGRDYFESVRRGERAPAFEEDFRCKDGATVCSLVAISAVLGASGQAVGVSQVVRAVGAPSSTAAPDDTQADRFEFNRQLLHLSRLGAMGQMAVALAHELNQPLTAIVSYLTSARRHLRQGASQDAAVLAVALDGASEQARRAAQIVRHLRSFVSKNKSGYEQATISTVIMEISELLLIAARQADVRVDFRLEPDTEVWGDRVQIQQVVFNLMRNAIEAMTGSPRRELSVSTVRLDDHVRICVADTGPGLDPQVAARLFEPFVTTKPDGMGVGLSICRTIIEQHGGTLWLEPIADGGAAFHFTLPFAEDRARTE